MYSPLTRVSVAKNANVDAEMDSNATNNVIQNNDARHTPVCKAVIVALVLPALMAAMVTLALMHRVDKVMVDPVINDISAERKRARKGCSNWEFILLASLNASLEKCFTACVATNGCATFDYQPAACDHAEGVAPMTCYLFVEGCEEEPNTCWDLYYMESPMPPSWSMEASRTGCSNWESIQLGEITVTRNPQICGSTCLDTDGCVAYNYQPAACGGSEAVAAGACMFFSDECDQGDNTCWDLYTMGAPASPSPSPSSSPPTSSPYHSTSPYPTPVATTTAAAATAVATTAVAATTVAVTIVATNTVATTTVATTTVATTAEATTTIATTTVVTTTIATTTVATTIAATTTVATTTVATTTVATTTTVSVGEAATAPTTVAVTTLALDGGSSTNGAATTIGAATTAGETAASTMDCGSCGTDYQFSEEEILTALQLHNKLRSAVGSPALSWNCELMCQAQRHADNCVFSHSASYDEPISAGENLASGGGGEMAAWMWFSEFGKAADETTSATFADGAGHFTAMVWSSTQDLGCGSCGAGGTYVCQYANSAPNFGGNDAFAENVPPFAGRADQYESAGLSATEARAKLEKFESWGFDIGYGLDNL